MLKVTIENALNEQIDNEMSSAHLYLSMAAHFEHEKLPGFAKWLKLQSREEFGHGMRLFDYILDRGGRVVLGGIEAPPATFGTRARSVRADPRARTPRDRVDPPVVRARTPGAPTTPRRRTFTGSSTSRWKRKRRPKRWWTSSNQSRAIRICSSCSTVSSATAGRRRAEFPDPRARSAASCKAARSRRTRLTTDHQFENPHQSDVRAY